MAKRITAILSFFILIFAAINGALAADKGDHGKIAEVRDFTRVAQQSAEKRIPLVLMFSSDYCAYCVRLENDFLVPMQISGDYEHRAIIRKVKIDYGNTVRDFDGKRIDADEFAVRYNVSVTPTVVFLDHQGNQLAPKQVGLTTPDFYGGYLDESIATALDILRRTRPLRVSLTD
jgi:thioredoxin-related protein